MKYHVSSLLLFMLAGFLVLSFGTSGDFNWEAGTMGWQAVFVPFGIIMIFVAIVELVVKLIGAMDRGDK